MKEHAERNQESTVVAVVAEVAREQTKLIAQSEQKMTDLSMCVRATGYLGDHFDFMDGGSWLNECAEAQAQYGQREVALLIRAEEIASYISERPMFAEGLCSMEENDWLEVSLAARRVMLHQRRTHPGQMVTLTATTRADRQQRTFANCSE